MNGRNTKRIWDKGISLVLTFGLICSGIGLIPAGEAKAAEPIAIDSAADLEKIGTDANYPLDGDYRLTSDIDMTGRNFTPIGGGEGARGSSSGANVFTGTFDGECHVISNLTIQKKESSAQEWQYGLFGMIGSDKADDKAAVRNLILTDLNIEVDMTAEVDNAYLSLGGLAGEVNKNAEIDNIAIVGGKIQGNRSSAGDVVGAGGLIGEMRPNDTSGTNSGVAISNIYIGTDIVCGSSTGSNYAGGIIGRVAKQPPVSVSSCVFTGDVSYKGDGGFGISGGDMTQNFSSCYYRSGLSNTGTAVSTEQLQGSKLLAGLDESKWTAAAGNYMILTQCVNSEDLRETLALEGLKLSLASGDTFSSVTQNFTVPTSIRIGTETEALTWTSDNETAIRINAADGTATVNPQFGAVSVALTAATKSGKTKTFSLTVKANLTLKFDQGYAKVGAAVTASLTGAPEGTLCTYHWSVDGVSRGTADAFTPVQEDLNKMLSVTAELTDGSGADLGECGPIQMYISKLPVVYIDTDDGSSIDSKTDYEGASMRVQGNDTFQQSEQIDLYDGAIEIRGRGNSTWHQSVNSGGKRPYKLKLGKKKNLLGFGESKHWALLANFMDESLLRNKTSYDLAKEMGIEPNLPSAHVELILNGKYAGNYQLVGNVRVQESRVNIFNWEDLAEDAADAIAAAEKANGQTVSQDALEEHMSQNMYWITSGSVSFQGKTYQISDYAIHLPKNSSGGVDVSGGFLFELDGYYDEVSKFRTTSNQPIMFKSPEFIRPTTGAGEGATEYVDSSKQKCDALYDYAREYIQAVEDTVHAPDYYVDIAETQRKENASNFTTDFKGRRHYTDLVDMDSLVKYLLLNEFYWNTETMKKSTFMYKDLGKKLQIGPVWDMDWTSNSIISQRETSEYDRWMAVTCQAGSFLQEQKESWYRYLIGDPYFVEKLYECYWDYREKFEDIAKDGGIIDQQREYLAESGASNYNLKGSLSGSCAYEEPSFDAGVERFQTYLQNRLRWMDQQFGWSETKVPDAASSKVSVDGLLDSFLKYQDTKGKISVSVDTETSEKETTYTASVTDTSIAKIGFYINGILADTVDVTEGKAVLTLNDGTAGLEKNIEKKAYVNNVVQVRAMDASGNLITNKGTYNGTSIDVCISDYTLFQKTIQADALTGTVDIQGLARVGCTVKAVVSDTNNTGKLSYQWKADGVPIERAIQESYTLTDAEEGKVITVEVTSNWETGSMVSAATKPVIKVVVLNDHLIINQVYGGGANEDSAVSHSFIELYNPTDQDISLAGYTIAYSSQGKNGGTAGSEEVLTLDAKTIPANHSYLIRCEAQTIVTPDYQFYLTIADDRYDQAWTQTIDNKRFKILLRDGEQNLADGVSVNEGHIEQEGEQLPDGAISKQKSIRRVRFADTNNNLVDFATVDYRETEIEQMKPRCLADGAWRAEEPEPEPTELKGTVSIRGNAVAGALLYADIVLEKTSYAGEMICRWKADGVEIEGASERFLPTDASLEGKKISVEVISADEAIEGKLTGSMESAIRVVEAQRGHLIIHQVYGDGGKKDAPISHSFIELYNPTDTDVDLSGYSIRYQSEDVTEELTLTGSIPSRHSYLIRCAASLNAASAPVSIAEPDLSWENLTINNKKYRVLLQKGETQADGVSVNEASAEGTALTDVSQDDTIISKNKAIRRICFVDTDQNADDFEVLNYTNLHEWNLTELLDSVKPRNTASGAWGLEKEETPGGDQIDPEILKNAQTAISEANRYKAIKSEYTKESYDKLLSAYTALQKALLTNNAESIQQATETLYQAIRNLVKAEPKKVSLAGTKFLYKKSWYQITKDTDDVYTVTYLKPQKKTQKSVKIPASVSYNGVSYKVTEIAKKAFAQNKNLRSVTIGKYVETIGASAFLGDGKLKTIKVESKVLKKVGKKALKGVSASCKIKVPKSQRKAYAKKFKKKGQKSSVRVV